MTLRKAKLYHIAIFLLPAFLLIGIFVLYPTFDTILMSFVDEDGNLSLSNYREVLTSRDIINPDGFKEGFPFGALIHNIMWIAVHLPLTTFLGLLLAVLLRNVKGGGIVKSVIFLGMVMPMIVGGIMIRFMFEQNVGVVNLVLSIFGFDGKTWTAYPETALFALIFGSIWLWTGFSLILYSAGLETIPDTYYEAAQIDGASPGKMFFRITVPLLKPITTVVVTMTLLWELKVFDIVYVATMGGPGGSSNVLAMQMYMYGFREWNFGKSAVVAVLIAVTTVVAAVPLMRSAGDENL